MDGKEENVAFKEKEFFSFLGWEETCGGGGGQGGGIASRWGKKGS